MVEEQDCPSSLRDTGVPASPVGFFALHEAGADLCYADLSGRDWGNTYGTRTRRWKYFRRHPELGVLFSGRTSYYFLQYLRSLDNYSVETNCNKRVFVMDIATVSCPLELPLVGRETFLGVQPNITEFELLCSEERYVHMVRATLPRAVQYPTAACEGF